MTAMATEVPSFHSPRCRVVAPPPDLPLHALPLLGRLRDALRTSTDLLAACEDRRRIVEQKRAKSGEPALFFFHCDTQDEWERSRPQAPAFPDPYLSEVAGRRPSVAAAWADLPDLLDDALTVLPASVECRRVARATNGLAAAAKSVGRHLPAARELAELLAVPDDEVILVVDVDRRTAARALLTGVADLSQLAILLADELPNRRRPDRRVAAAYREETADPGAAVATAPFQLLRPTALRPDGTLPAGFAASDHWFWGQEPTAVLPRENGERVVLLTATTVPHSWDVGRRFPRLPARVELVEVLSPSAVSDWFRARCPAMAAPNRERARAA